MAVNARIWIVPDANDLARTVKFAGANVGDFLFEFDNSTLWVIHQTGLLPISGSNAASTTVAGIVKQITQQALLTDSTGGTASTTFAAIAAGASYAQGDIVAIKNALAQIALQFNNLRTAMHNAGIST